MTPRVPSPQQQTQGPPAPPIPALPPRPGAPTGQAGQAGQQGQPGGGGGQPGAGGDLITLPELAGTPSPELTTGTGFPVDPQAIIRETIPIVGMTLGMVACVFIGFPLARAFARRMDKRTELGTVDARQLLPQIRQLQDSVDAMSIELERIGEAQRFQAKLLSERSSASASQKT